VWRGPPGPAVDFGAGLGDVAQDAVAAVRGHDHERARIAVRHERREERLEVPAPAPRVGRARGGGAPGRGRARRGPRQRDELVEDRPGHALGRRQVGLLLAGLEPRRRRRRRGVGVREFALVDRPADVAPERLAQRLRGRAVLRDLLLDGVLHGPGQGVLLLLLDAPRAARARVALEPRRRLVFEEVAELRPRVRAHRLARVHLRRGVRHDRGHAVRHGAAKQGQHLPRVFFGQPVNITRVSSTSVC
jgi:hypothetical protein